MKITVDMTEEEYAEFVKFRAKKKIVVKEFTDFRRRAEALARAVFAALDVDENEHRAQVVSYEKALQAEQLAYEL